METKTLASYAANLKYDALPENVVERAKTCILDALAGAIYGPHLPWGRIIVDYARRCGPGGSCTVLGVPGLKVQAPAAALANGTLAHSFELDNVRKPGAGVHPGATLTPASLAVAEDLGASGRDMITALVAGCEVMSRIGHSTKYSIEKVGFHAPGVTGVFGSTIVSGRLMGLDDERMRNAMGIAGSLCSGLMEFATSKTGGMVKRLHCGRASEAGVLAASLAREGYEGPETILEGKFGFLSVFARNADRSRLTEGLGSDYEILKICIKSYPAHISAHAPIQAIQAMREETPFAGEDIESITLASSEKAVSHNNIPEPKDVMLMQYSAPFCTALSLYKDPADPRSFAEETLRDGRILALSRRTSMAVHEKSKESESFWGCRVSVRLKDGRELVREVIDFKGTPENPLGPEDLARKFSLLTSALGEAESGRLLERVRRLETEANVREIFAEL